MVCQSKSLLRKVPERIVKKLSTEALLADRGYDTNDILSYAVSAGTEPVIPPRKNRKEQRDYDNHLYKLRHLAEKCGMRFL